MTTENTEAPQNGTPDLEALKQKAANSFRQSRTSILAKEAHAAYVAALQRAFPDRKVSKVAHVAYFEDPKLPIIMVASDPGTTVEQCQKILLTAAKTLTIPEEEKSSIDKKEEISS